MQGRVVNDTFASGDLKLSSFIASPPHTNDPAGVPGLVICHGFPVGAIGAAQSAHSFPELCERIANELGWAAMCFTLRGCGQSDGNFSLGGWQADLAAAVAYFRTQANLSQLWLAGLSTGGSLAISLAANDPTIAGVACLCARADIDDWLSQPRRFLQHAREIGVIRDPGEPRDFDGWLREFKDFKPVVAARKLAPRPLLLVQGSDDDVVPVEEARILAAAHGAADLHIVSGAGHRLRHDPRALAILLGWLDRQRHIVAASARS